MARTIARDHDDKRSMIRSEAARVFADEGVDRASMNRIATACGISKANIYHYYDGKHALLFDLLEGYLKELRDRVVAADDPALGPEKRFRILLREVMRAYQGADDHHRVQISGLGALPSDKREVLRGYQRDLVSHMAGVLKALAPERLADRATLRATTMSVFGMLNWYFMWNSGAGTKARVDYARIVADLTLNGIGARPIE